MDLLDLLNELLEIYIEKGNVRICVFNEYLDNPSEVVMFKFMNGDYFDNCENIKDDEFLLLG